MARWRIVPVHTPRLVRRCSRCDTARSFACADAFRINASGRRLDAWLLYRCTSCSDTWKAPVHERIPVDRLDRARLDALHRNDRTLAWSCAFDPGWLARLGAEVDPEVAVTVERDADGCAGRIEIAVAYPLPVRLDRLLARELRLSRSELERRVGEGAIEILPGGARSLRRPLHSGLIIVDRRAE
jgi:hypothetical protein